MSANVHDLVVVGYGPVGQTLTALLGRAGLDVAVYERFPAGYGLPRAIRFDHEAMRLWQALGIADELLEDALPVNRYEWFGADGQPIVKFDIPEGPSGWPFSYVFFQPYLEAALDGAVEKTDAEVNRGWTLVDLTQHDDHVELALHATEGLIGAGEPEVRSVRARYVVAADGARSSARELLGIAMEDLGFNERWLVVDVRPNGEAPAFEPFPQQFCDPARPHMQGPNGRTHRRWEFMLLPGERAEDFDDPERVWAMLAPTITPDQGHVVRRAVYEFESAVAETMRAGRCFLAGDAAHLMPPHLGEGMCSGLRDAHNLAWKLEAVVDGGADERLLESYSTERLPHARALVEQSQAMGRVSCVLDPHAAAERDRGLRAAGGVEPWPFPRLGEGFAYRGANAIEALRGRLAVQGRVTHRQQTGRLDDVVGRGFVLIVRAAAGAAAVSAARRDALERLGAHVVALGHDTEDAGGELDAWLAAHDAAAVVVRPDFYVFGAVTSLGAVDALVDDLLAQLATRQVTH